MASGVTEARTSTRSRANTRARLLAAAAEVFVEHGIEGATVDHLVAAAGFTRGAFYSNFSSMSEVFHDFFTVTVRENLTAVEEAVNAIPPEEISVASILDVLEATNPSDRNTYVLTRELELRALRDPAMAQVHAEFQQTLLDALIPMMTEVLGRLGRQPRLPLDQLGEALVAVYMASLGRELHGQDHAGARDWRLGVFEAITLGASEPA
ncbi:MAG TPA: TetR/AcrR family transcriptional regulator [Actinomycetales bacterium]|nr:TetR/AcrR family transcriptional regulator [Actinomycetales bacterium]